MINLQCVYVCLKDRSVFACESMYELVLCECDMSLECVYINTTLVPCVLGSSTCFLSAREEEVKRL